MTLDQIVSKCKLYDGSSYITKLPSLCRLIRWESFWSKAKFQQIGPEYLSNAMKTSGNRYGAASCASCSLAGGHRRGELPAKEIKAF